MGFVASIDQVYMNIRIVYPYLCLFQPQDDYSVLFEDTSYADGYSPPLNVAQRYVVACKENKKKWQKNTIRDIFGKKILHDCCDWKQDIVHWFYLYVLSPPFSVTMYIVLAYFILHLLYDVFVSPNARRPTVSEFAKVINPLYVN